MATYPLTITAKQAEGRDAASLWFDVPRDLDTTFSHRAGQFITIEQEIRGEVLLRQYSISSSPDRAAGFRITAKKVPEGRMSSWLVDQTVVGDVLQVAPPRGVFFKPPEEPRHTLLLAAGSGVAPMIPIARSLLDAGPDQVITLVCGNRTPDHVVLRDDLEALCDHPLAEIEHVFSRVGADWAGSRGRVDRTYLEDRLPVWARRGNLPMSAYLCGPEPFMDVAESVLMGFGLGNRDIRRESFDLVLNDDDDGPPIPVVSKAPGEEGSCRQITAVMNGEENHVAPKDGESILEALLRIDADVPFSCQEGDCSSCIAKLTYGTALVRSGVLKTLRECDLEDGLVLACLAQPTSRHVRIDFDEL